MDEENVANTHHGVFFSHKKLNYAICRKMDGIGDHHVKQEKSD
jgi:hypothetical protein